MGISDDVIGDVIGRVIGVIKCKVDQDEQLPFYCCLYICPDTRRYFVEMAKHIVVYIVHILLCDPIDK